MTNNFRENLENNWKKTAFSMGSWKIGKIKETLKIGQKRIIILITKKDSTNKYDNW